VYGGNSFGGLKTSASKISEQFLTAMLPSSKSFNNLGSEKYRDILYKSRGTRRRKLV
jgi:hypothetical protein